MGCYRYDAERVEGNYQTYLSTFYLYCKNPLNWISVEAKAGYAIYFDISCSFLINFF